MLWMYCCDRSAECWVTPNVCHPPPTEVSPTEQNRSNVCPIWRLSHYLLHLHITNSCAICKPVQLLSSQMWMFIWLFLCMWTWDSHDGSIMFWKFWTWTFVCKMFEMSWKSSEGTCVSHFPRRQGGCNQGQRGLYYQRFKKSSSEIGFWTDRKTLLNFKTISVHSHWYIVLQHQSPWVGCIFQKALQKRLRFCISLECISGLGGNFVHIAQEQGGGV